MKTFILILTILFLIAFSIPFIGFATLFGYIFKKSLQKKTPEFLQKEKNGMEEKVHTMKSELVPWNDRKVDEITNDIEYSYMKGMSNKLTGYINSPDAEPIIAFQRIDRGIFTNSRIIAESTDFKIDFEYLNNENVIFYNGIYLGKTINNSEILNSLHQKIGSYQRDLVNSQNRYSIVFGSQKKAQLFRNDDRKNFINNSRYKRHWRPYKSRINIKNYRETPPINSVVSSVNSADAEEQKWIIALAVFESIYFGFEFVS